MSCNHDGFPFDFAQDREPIEPRVKLGMTAFCEL
jgi:hypothetical protein